MLSNRPGTLNLPDPYDYAQIARNLFRGNGFITKVIAPVTWAKYPTLPHPDFWRAPLYPLLIAFTYNFTGVNTLAPLVVSSVAFSLCAVFVTAIVYRSHSIVPSLAAGFLTLTYPNLLKSGVNGFSEATYLLLISASVFTLLREDEHPYLVGILSGLAYLTRFNHWFLLVMICLIGLKRTSQPGSKYLIKLLGAYVFTLSPWMIRNLWLGVSPLFHVHQYLLALPEARVETFTVFYRFDVPDPFFHALTHPVTMLSKWFGNLVTLYRWVPGILGTGWLMALLGIGYYFVPFSRTKNNAIADGGLIFLGGFVLQGLGLSFVHLQTRHMMPFLLAVPILGTSAAWNLARRQSIRYTLVVALLGINLLFLGSVGSWTQQIASTDYSSLRDKIPEGERLVSNAPMTSAWYTDRVSMWGVPYREGEENYPDYNYVVLYREVTRRSRRGTAATIKDLYLNSRAFKRDFKLVHRNPTTGVRVYQRR